VTKINTPIPTNMLRRIGMIILKNNKG